MLPRSVDLGGVPLTPSNPLPTMTIAILENAFPRPSPLTPRLTALGLNSITAEEISRLHSSAALTLKEKYEAEYIHACNSIIVTSEKRGYSSENLRSKLLEVLATRYAQEISKQVEEFARKVEVRLSKGRRRCTQILEVRMSSWCF